MQKIYWFVQQLNQIGGTEMVSIELMKHLSQYFDITLVSVAEIKGDIVYDTANLEIKSLNIPLAVCRYDAYLSRALKQHHYLEACKLTGQLIKYFLVQRNKYRQQISAMTQNDDLIIASSMDSYIYAPNDRCCIFHYHFNGQTYLSLNNRLLSKLARTSDMTVFLTKDTYDYVLNKKPDSPHKYTYIYNPSRFKRQFYKAHATARFIFMGRLEKQKNPMCLLKAMNELKKQAIDFHLDILGDGSYFKEMQDYIIENGLNDNITMVGQVTNIEDYLKANDFNLLTSTFEGFPLSIIEATSFGLYNISTNWGDAVNEAIDGMNGCIIDSFDAQVIAAKIIEILGQDANELKYQSYLDAERFDIDQIVHNWVQLINQINKEK